MRNFNKKSFNAGIKWGVNEFDNVMQKHIETGYPTIFKKYDTCFNYATNYKISRTKKGTYLNQDKRDFYSGVCVGLSNRFAKFDRNFTRGEF